MFPIGIKSFIVYLEGFVTVCTASLVSFQACLDVRAYVPGYVNDLNEYVRYKPYEKEQIYLNKQ